MFRSVLLRLPRLLWFSFIPDASGPYSRFSLQRILVMLLFWPVFLFYLTLTGLCLWLDHLFFPAFRKVKIHQPLMVVGIPRSGTTFLHRLLAGDEKRFTTMTLQELIFTPSLLQRHLLSVAARVDQLAGSPCNRLINVIQRKLFSGLDGVHKTGLQQSEEDYLGFIPVLSCFLLILPFGDPRFMNLCYFDRMASATERQQLMQFYRGLIQRHLYAQPNSQQGPRRYLCKNPSFTPMIKTLAEAFPDAQFIGCVRTPSESVPSQISSILVGARLFSGQDTTSWWCKNLMQMLHFYYDHLLSLDESSLSSRFHYMRMEQLATAPGDSIESVYSYFRWPMNAAYRNWLKLEQEAAQRYQSQHHYLAETLGIEQKTLAQQFDFAYRKLGYLPPEYFETS